MSSVEKTKPVVVRLGDSILAELKGPNRNVRLSVGLDYFWRNAGTSDKTKWEKTQEECLIMKLGQRSSMRFEKTKKNIDTIVEALLLAKKELL